MLVGGWWRKRGLWWSLMCVKKRKTLAIEKQSRCGRAKYVRAKDGSRFR